MERIARYHLEPQTGIGLQLRRGQVLKIIDPGGEQVSDVVAFARSDTSERLSSGRSLDYNNTVYLTTGHILYSNRSNPMFTISSSRHAARRPSRSSTRITRGTTLAASRTWRRT